MDLDPALTVPCPECRAAKNEPCISRHAISVHRARREALARLERQATRLLGVHRQKRPTRNQRQRWGLDGQQRQGKGGTHALNESTRALPGCSRCVGVR